MGEMVRGRRGIHSWFEVSSGACSREWVHISQYITARKAHHIIIYLKGSLRRDEKVHVDAYYYGTLKLVFESIQGQTRPQHPNHNNCTRVPVHLKLVYEQYVYR
jgi:hypothetical protein